MNMDPRLEPQGFRSEGDESLRGADPRPAARVAGTNAAVFEKPGGAFSSQALPLLSDIAAA